MENSKKYQEILRKGFDLETVRKILSEYTENNDIPLKCEFNWNHAIEGFHLNNNGTVSIEIYWQGDSTDGTSFIPAAELVRNRRYVIPAETFFDGERTRTTHSDIRVEFTELQDAAGKLVEWLEPENIAKRAEHSRLNKAQTRIIDYYRNQLGPKLKARDEYRYKRTLFKMYSHIAEHVRELESLTESNLETALMEVYKEIY